eukprot:8659678-Lingulodinium_polyedra.AAC.1
MPDREDISDWDDDEVGNTEAEDCDPEARPSAECGTRGADEHLPMQAGSNGASCTSGSKADSGPIGIRT